MTGSVSAVILAAVLRYHLRPVRHLVCTMLHGSEAYGRTWAVRLGPVEVRGHQVVLRSPRLDDGPVWCAVRIREQARIEPWWVTSSLTWQERHTEAEWASMFLMHRRAALRGLALPLVVDVDGRLAGECNLEWIDAGVGTAELGCWLDSQLGARGPIVRAAGAMMIEHVFTTLALHRLSAPICEGNAAAAWAARRLGMVCEGTMAQFLDVGGRRRSHQLWAITADRWRSPVPPVPAAEQTREPAEAIPTPRSAQATR